MRGGEIQLNTSEFTALVEQYEKLVYTVCFQLVRDPFTAQDLCQETFLSAWQGIDRCDPGSYRPWLARIATNKALDYLKKASTRMEAPTEILPEQPVDGPELRVIADAGAAALEARIRALSPPYREVAELSLLQDLLPGEIAARLNRPEKTVYTQLSRVKKQLQKSLRKEVPYGPSD